MDDINKKIYFSWKPPLNVPHYKNNVRPGSRDVDVSTIRMMNFDGSDNVQVRNHASSYCSFYDYHCFFYCGRCTEIFCMKIPVEMVACTF